MTERITSLLAQQQWKELKHLLNEELSFQELWELLEQLSAHQQVILFRLLAKDTALEIFELMEPLDQHSLLEAFTDQEVTEMFSSIDPEDQVRLMDELPAKVAKELLRAIPKQARDRTAILMGFASGTVGRVMSPLYLRVRQDEEAGQALTRFRKLKPDREMMLDIWVTNAQRVLEGVVTLRDLVLAEPEQTIGEIMDDDVVFVTADTDQEDAVSILKKFDLVSLPVVDSEQRLIGMLEYDRAMDILQEEADEDVLEKAGLLALQEREETLSHRVIHGSLLEVMMVRLPFLAITLVGGLLAGVVISRFEAALETAVALAFFIPIIMDMGGNVGTQSITIFTRSLVLGHIRPSHFLPSLLKEAVRGLTIGVIIGTITGTIGYFWQGDASLGLVVALSLFFTITLAATLGFFIPWVLYKMNMDQAAGAGPIITTIKDISSLLIYFWLASMFMSILA